MNDEVKEILIDLIDYYNVIGTEEFGPFADVVHRASKALECYAKETNQLAKAIDPFQPYDEFPDAVIKMEEDLF